MKRPRALLREIHDRLYAVYGELTCPLAHGTPFQLLAAVMLSAQCRDDRVNEVTVELFRRWPDAAAMAKADPDEVARIIQPCGLFRAKSRNLTACAAQLVREHGGEVPRTMAELTRLPGIGRKSANVILGNAFGLPGFPADTHVIRLTNRLGAVDTDDPEKIEAVVNAAIPPEQWCNFSHLLITHGRRVCHARNPACGDCVLGDLCPSRRKA